MAKLRFSRSAKADLLKIGAYTVNAWGEDQAIRYIEDLQDCCSALAHSPRLGRACHDVAPGLRRIERGRHVIFYREDAKGLLVSRILHQRMLPSRWVR